MSDRWSDLRFWNDSEIKVCREETVPKGRSLFARENDALDDSYLRVGLIGLGAIGQSVLQILSDHYASKIEVVSALVLNMTRVRNGQPCHLVTTVDDFLRARPDVVLEVGGHQALASIGPQVLRSGCDLLMVSVGALADPKVESELLYAARAGKSRAHVVSGAIGGLDALSAAAIGGLTSVTVTTRKPATSLLGIETLDAAREIFSGTAREAALKFPESVNVAAAVALAGIGFDLTQVHVIADPGINLNRHEVIAEGAFGTMRIEICNVPTELNPKSAKLVAMSAVRALIQRHSLLIVG